jgi:RND family efflux transporter MFP subunit
VVASEVAGVVARLAVRSGSRVTAGQTLAELRREPVELRLDAARGQLDEAEARLASAELKLERFRELLSSDVISRQQVDDASYEADAWRGRAHHLRAEVSRLERDLRQTAVAAPFAGVISREHTHEGQWLDIGAPVAELIDLDHLEVRLEVPERYYSELREGTAVEVHCDALPGLAFPGKIRAVVPNADPRARTFPVLITLADPDHHVGAGMLAQVELPIGAAEPATIVPKDALTDDGRASQVYLFDGGTVRRIEVEPGAGLGDWIAITGAIAPGDRVIVRGNERLSPGQPVAGEALEVPLP